MAIVGAGCSTHPHAPSQTGGGNKFFGLGTRGGARGLAYPGLYTCRPYGAWDLVCTARKQFDFQAVLYILGAKS